MELQTTNRQLYELLEGKFTRSVQGQEDLAPVVTKHYDRFKLLLDYFKKPSASSKQKLKELPETKLLNNEKAKLSAEVAEFILSVSETLELDELQTLNLYQNYFLSHPSATDRLPDIVDLFHYYNEERLYLLECIVSMFRNNNDDSHPAIPQTVEQLYQDKILGTVMDQYSQLSDHHSKVPSQLNQSQAMIWANRVVAEQAAQLRIMFYIFFEDRFDFAVLPKLAKLLHYQDFGSKQPHYALLNEKGRETVITMNYLASLILVEALRLETLFSGDEEEKLKHPLSVQLDIAVDLNSEFCAWAEHPMPHHGPVLLAWTTASCALMTNNPVNPSTAISRSPTDLQKSSNVKFDYTKTLGAALSCGAFSYLKFMLQSSSLRADEMNLLAYKSVLRGLLLALFTAFSIERLLEHDALLLVDLYCELFSKQPDLCRLFWEEDFRNSRGILLDITKQEFPFHLVPFVKIVTALAGDKNYAHRVFHYLDHLDSYSVPGEDKFQQYVISDATGMRVEQPFNCQGVALPILAHGIFHGRERRVTWTNLNYSAWSHFHYRLRKFARQVSSGTRNPAAFASTVESVQVILRLIHDIVSQDPLLALKMQERVQRRKSRWISIFLEIFTHLAFASNLTAEIVEILSLTLHCIADFAHTSADELWAHRSISSAGAAGIGIHASRDIQKQISSALISCMPHLLHNYELPSGKFTLTLPLLQLVKTMLQYLQRWVLPLNISNSIIDAQNQFAQYLEYIRLHILVSFNTWRYSNVSERWQIGLLLMEILQLILSDVSTVVDSTVSGGGETTNEEFSIQWESDAMDLDSSRSAPQGIKYSLLQWLLYDSSFHNVILNIISSGSETLTHLRATRTQSEIFTLEELILRAFDVLERVLLERDGITRGESSLEHSLMSFLPGREHSNFILVISSFILYRYNRKLPLIATRILRLLCQLSLLSEFSQRRPSLVAYLGNEGSLICTQLMQLLKGNHSRNEELHIEILQLVSTTLEFQLGMAELLLRLDKEKDDDTSVACGPVTCVLAIMNSAEYPSKQPKLYAAALSLLHSLWEWTPDHSVVHTLLRNSKVFWNQLIEPLRLISCSGEKQENRTTENYSFLLAMSGWSLRILSMELYYNKEAIDRLQGFVQLSEFIQENLSNLCAAFSVTPFDSSTLLTQFEKTCKTNRIDASLFYRGAARQTFGPSPLYHIDLVKRKLSDFDSSFGLSSSTLDSKDQQIATKTLIELFFRVNSNMALLDARLGTFKSFQLFVELITAHSSINKSLCKVELFAPLIRQLAAAINVDHNSLPATQTHLELMSDLLIHQINQYNVKRERENNSSLSLSSTGVNAIETIQILSTAIEKFISAASYSTDTKFNDVEIPQAKILSNLFFSVLLLLPHQQTGEEMQDVLLNLIPSVCIGSSCQELKQTCFLLLSVIVRQFSNTEALVSYLNKYQMFHSILESFTNATSQEQDSYSIADASIQLLLSLASSSPFTAEQLVINKIMFVLCDTSQRFFHHNLSEAYTSKQRNPLHRIWCQVVRVVTQMAFSLHDNEEFHQLLPRFIIIHQERLLDKWLKFQDSENPQRRLDFTSSPSKNSFSSNFLFSIGILEEIECVTALYDRWVHSLNDWKLSFTPRTIEITSHLRFILQYFVLSLMRPSDLLILSNPITEEEQKNANWPKSSKTKKAASVSFSLNSSADFSLTPKEDYSSFQKQIVGLMHRCISNCLSFLRQLSPKPWNYHFDASNIFVLFTPTLEPSTPQAAPCLGVLVYYSVLCIRLLEREKDSALLDVLAYNFHNALAVLLLQISVYPFKPEIEFDANQLKSNLERLLHSQLFQKLPSKFLSLRSFVEYTLENINAMIR